MINFLTIGLPKSGKTTFLAALYSLVEDLGEGCRLKLGDLPENSSYILSISKDWLHWRQVQRSSTNLDEEIELNLIDSSGTAYYFNFPDLSGEEFSRQWAARTCSEAYIRKLSKASGVLLFLSSSVHKSRQLVDFVDLLKEENSLDQKPVEPFDPNLSSDGVKIVELLQIASDFSDNELTVSVIISAWDQCLAVDQLTPQRWLDKHIPLLSQYLETNFQERHHVFGVSAQGGSYEDDLDEMQTIHSLQDRVLVQDDKEISHDITLPIMWLVDHIK